MALSPTFGQSGKTVCLGEGFGLGFNLSQSSPRTRLSSNGMPACTSSSLRNSALLLAFNLRPIPDHNLVDHSHMMSAKVTYPLSANSRNLPYIQGDNSGRLKPPVDLDLGWSAILIRK